MLFLKTLNRFRDRVYGLHMGVNASFVVLDRELRALLAGMSWARVSVNTINSVGLTNACVELNYIGNCTR